MVGLFVFNKYTVVEPQTGDFSIMNVDSIFNTQKVQFRNVLN